MSSISSWNIHFHVLDTAVALHVRKGLDASMNVDEVHLFPVA